MNRIWGRLIPPSHFSKTLLSVRYSYYQDALEAILYKLVLMPRRGYLLNLVVIFRDFQVFRRPHLYEYHKHVFKCHFFKFYNFVIFIIIYREAL